jgi:hypothetical protein
VPKFLTQQQVGEYHRQGFVSPINVMSEDEAQHYAQRLEVAESRYPQELNAENRNNLHLAFRFLDELVHHPIILDAVEEVRVHGAVWQGAVNQPCRQLAAGCNLCWPEPAQLCDTVARVDAE